LEQYSVKKITEILQSSLIMRLFCLMDFQYKLQKIVRPCVCMYVCIYIYIYI
jgi:hypothetical protein